MHFNELGFSDGTLCASVARAIVHDAAINTLGTGGFPQITARRSEGGFSVELKMQQHTQSFDITTAEASRMVDTLRSSEQHDIDVFDRIQDAVARLEGATINSR